MNKKEIWKEVNEYQGVYEVSNLGRVKSTRTNKIRKLHLSKIGYYTVGLCSNGIRKTEYVHHLIARSFLNHKTSVQGKVIDHINNVKSDNRLENLQIITRRENNVKDKKNGTSKYTGVTWDKDRCKWRSVINNKLKKYHLGYFDNEEDASKAYKKKLKEIQK